MSSRSGRRIPFGVVCLFLVACGLFLVACGNQGDPAPPLRSVPAPTSDLKVRQQGNRLLLDFAFPQTTPAGMALGGITSIEVWEAVQPAPREGKPAPIDARVFQSAATQKLKLAQADVAPATFGNRILIPLPLPEPAPAAPQAPPQARYYAVRTTGPTGDRSDFSNQVAIVPGTPPAAPERLSVTARPDGVLVEWSGTEGAAAYNVYRRGADERSLGQPIHSAGPQERSWLDNTARLGQSYIYGVTAVLSPLGGQDPLVESAVASEQEVRYQDRFPPPPPLELVALAEGGRVRLVWRAAEAEDLAGYYVYRRGAEGDFERITPQPLQDTELVDSGVSAGQTYSYRVTAVDKLGNESGPGAEVRASVPPSGS
ncbi:MAG: fibronectin type III domain-containing protein [Thermoanaerobaculia bacterium]